MNNTNSRSVNWSLLITELGSSVLRDFADGNLSGRELYADAVAFSRKASPEVRNLLRSRGVAEARKLARKALARR